MMRLGAIWDAVGNAKVIDLAHALERGMPVSPNHPAFQLAMMRRHGDMIRSDGGSAANEMIVLGGHVGTHIDALGHVSQDGAMYGGIDAMESQSNTGLTQLGVDTVDPILSRGVLLDVAKVHGVDVLAAGYEVTAEDLDDAQKAADVVVSAGRRSPDSDRLGDALGESLRSFSARRMAPPVRACRQRSGWSTAMSVLPGRKRSPSR